MRGGAGLAIDRDSSATPAPSPAIEIRKCMGCGSHFGSPRSSEPTEDPAGGLRCPVCLEWAELHERRISYAHGVRGQRGGRR